MDIWTALLNMTIWPPIAGFIAALAGLAIWGGHVTLTRLWMHASQWELEKLVGMTLKSFFISFLLMAASRLARSPISRIAFEAFGLLLLVLFFVLAANLLWRGWLKFCWPAFEHLGQTLQRAAHSRHR